MRTLGLIRTEGREDGIRGIQISVQDCDMAIGIRIFFKKKRTYFSSI